ncbi:putative short-subunit dehydrogenase-like oxidoreductase (DUF2520 family) [Mucilaginibacter gracilis]|uniref:Putative short-subunit dehydrogenase-like oxidoreductase (DUF2520 family) n=1 Tax=Mucilaginibacter gracilis TaxID=423350 RepID=A0A495J135_9SPHI|nr:DUF2520 domain-containing protein [Mucilaginibacter gracilis]RKR82706.1 putative short-subunit dehydrogenase-like oxidoreductase (DUF2520 family) [Mucilaginibacter gracilis]
MRITIIGSGNVATHLAAALKNAGHKIIQVFSPTYQNAAMLAYHVGAQPIDALSEIDPVADIFMIAVKDDAIEGIAKQLAAYNKLTVHTSGATSLQTILNYNPLSGVFYPLQTFSKTKEVDFWQVPLCIEGADNDITAQLELLAQTISNNVQRVSTSQRTILHLAAVFACNFPNNLYAIAQMLLAQHQLDFGLLRPLIMETAQKVQTSLPIDVQTGPAVRNDTKTMAAHIDLLLDLPALRPLYEALSQSIIKMGIEHKADK